MAAKDDPIVIKKYANRRLYNTGTSTYVTLEDLAEMVKKGEDFTVQDAKTGDDITHPVLTQIIFELENKDGHNMLPIPFLRQLIAFYGDQMQMIVPSFLEQSMLAFSKEQERFREQMKATLGKSPVDMMKMTPMKALEDVGLANWAGHAPNELSGGQQQRVAIARAIVTSPSLLLADEPTGNLDTARSREIMDLLVQLNRDKGITIAMVTHEADMAAYAHRIIGFRDGLIETDGVTERAA